MKKLMVLTIGVLFSTLVFANSTAGPKGSSVAVINSGSDLIKVYYKSLKPCNVFVSIRNEREEIVFSEKITKSDGFMRPYNFKNLPSGQYTIQVEDEQGKQVEKINYRMAKVETHIAIAKVTSKMNDYFVSGFSTGSDRIIISIYDANGAIVLQEEKPIDGKLYEVYDLSKVAGAFSIEVSNDKGVIESFKK